MNIALLGNQNSGKTSIFNALTGSNKKVGNWPGVTIDHIEGRLKRHPETLVTDLPGIYSLSPYSNEEEISRRFVLDEDVDLILNVVDSTSIERSLYLTTQLLELNIDVVIALNMYDLLKKKGIKIKVEQLSNELGVTIVPVSAKDGTGITKLIDIIHKRKYKKNKHKKIYPADVEKFISKVSVVYQLNHKSVNTKKIHQRFSAVKILEEDRDYRVLMNDDLKKQHLELEEKYKMDGEQLIASLRYDYIEKIREKCVVFAPKKESISDRLDKIFLHKYLAIPIFILIMAAVYFISISIVGGLTNCLIDAAFKGATELNFQIAGISWTVPVNIAGLGPLICDGLKAAGASQWALSLVNNGVIGGVSAVATFIPQLMMLFLCLGLLETTGYMSRIAFFLDRIFHKLGLSGKSLVPFIVGAGCSVPGIMNTRIIEDENERKATIALVPFVPCNAKLTIISLISAAFFSKWGFAFALLFYVMAIVIIILVAFLFKKFIYKKQHSTYISELPDYKIPDGKYILRDVGDKTWSFVKRAGTIVLFFSVIVWVLTSFTWNFQYVDGIKVGINQSMLAGIGNAFAWFFYPMLGCHWSWAASVSAIQGIVAKEQVVSSMQVIANMSNGGIPIGIFNSSIFSFFTPLTAFAFASFNLFTIPCVGALSAMKAEFKSIKNMILVMLLEIVVAWLIASLIGVWGVLL